MSSNEIFDAFKGMMPELEKNRMRGISWESKDLGRLACQMFWLTAQINPGRVRLASGRRSEQRRPHTSRQEARVEVVVASVSA
jgi:hypothetical protein